MNLLGLEKPEDEIVEQPEQHYPAYHKLTLAKTFYTPRISLAIIDQA